MSAFDLERAVAEWRKELRRNPALEDGQAAELEASLRDEIEELTGKGLDPGTAFRQAVAAMGPAADAGGEFYKAKRARRSARPPWQAPRFVPGLIWSYILVAWRRVRRERAYSAINIAGLAAGLACAILIFLWARHELSYDRFHENSGRIGRVLLKPDNAEWLTDSGPGPLGPTLQRDYPEVVAATRSFGAPAPLRLGSRVFNGRVLGVDPSFFRIFSFPFVRGGGGEPLADPDSVVLAGSMAKKLFGTDDPLGQSVGFEWWGTWHDLRVVGVVADAPSNSSLRFDYLLPFSFVTRSGMSIDDWDVSAYQTYVLIADTASMTDVGEKVAGAVKRVRPESRFELRLQPLTRMHLHDPEGGGPIAYVRIVVLIGLFVLAIASINFMNLSTARSLRRAREVGLRKVVGSSRGGLIRQFLMESVVFTALALALALVTVALLLPWVNQAFGASLRLRFTTGQALAILAMTLLTGLLSGSYPALFLSKFEPLQVLRGSVTKGRSGLSLRRLLVVFQFVISIGLTVGTLTVSRQLLFMRHRDLGINTDRVINLELRGDLRNNYRAIKARLLESPDIVAVSATNGSFTKRFATDRADWEGKDPEAKMVVAIHAVDYDYPKIFDLEMAEGRYFSRDRPADRTTAFVVNETAVRIMGLKEPLGKKLRCPIPFDPEREEWGTIIGVVKDFHFRSLHSRIEPLVLAVAPGWFTDTYIRIGPADVPRAMAFIDKTFREEAPGFPLEYTFLDETIARLYRTEARIADMVGSATVLAVLISCLGLFGLASYTAEQRMREIGIRKALGASAAGVMSLLTGEFIRWVLAAGLIAWPVSYLVMRNWLRTFAYRVDLGWQVFALAGALAGAVTLLSVGFQAVRAATANPIDSLREE